MKEFERLEEIVNMDQKEAFRKYGLCFFKYGSLELDKLNGVWGISKWVGPSSKFYQSVDNTLTSAFEIADKLIEELI